MTDATPQFDYIPVPELPSHLTKQVNEAIRLHSVSMVLCDQDESKGLPCAGVFVTIDNVPGILTAGHVWTEMRKREKLVLMVGPRPYRINTALLSAHEPQGVKISEPFSAKIPDIAFVPLSSKDKGVIETYRKVFYSIDRRIIDSSFDLHGVDGFFVAIGSPKALLKQESRAVASLTYITGVEKKISLDGWDYLFVNIDLDSNNQIPEDLGGMSGGGIWRVKFHVNADRTQCWLEDPAHDIILVGLTFFQTQVEGRQLIAHGPTSIYENLYNFVVSNRQ